MAQTTVIRKTQMGNQRISETKKMVRLIRKQSAEMRLSTSTEFLVLVEVDGSIEIKEASPNFGARIAGQVVERLQALHDSICAKMTVA